MGDREFTDTDLGLDILTEPSGIHDLRHIVAVGFTKQASAIRQLGRDVIRLEGSMVSEDLCLRRAAELNSAVKDTIREEAKNAITEASVAAARKVNGHKPFWPTDARGWMALVATVTAFLGWLGINIYIAGPK